MADSEASAAIDATPGGENSHRTIKEGKATILVPRGAKVGEDKSEVQQVFYNPIQQFNRDLSVLAIKAYGEETIERRKTQYLAKANKKSKKRKRGTEANGDENTAGVPQDGPTTHQAEEAASQPNPTDTFTTTFKILDALSASGLRALRYAHELPFVTSITANDLSASAAESIKANVTHNGLEDKITVTNDNALSVMYRAIADDLSKLDRLGNPGKAHKFDVIDLDPYGTGAPFFDAAVQCVRDDGGLLCITCTDSAVWAGHSYCEKTYSLYGGVPVKGAHSHEVGLRLILNAIATSAARYGLHIEPQLSLSIDFYTKVFVKVTKSAQAVKFLGSKTMLVYSCSQGCGAWTTQYLMKSKPSPNKKGDGLFYKHGMTQAPTSDRLCQHCGLKMHLNGPMYGGRIHSQEFIQRLLDQLPKADKSVYGTLPRLEGMLRTALEEYIPGPDVEEGANPKDAAAAAVDPYPFYVVPNRLASAISSVSIPDDMFRGALFHLGYRITRSHCKPGSMKTDAPWSTIWWIMTEWVRQKAPVTAANIKPRTAAHAILTRAGLLPSENSSSTTNGGTTGPKDQDTTMEEAPKGADDTTLDPQSDVAEDPEVADTTTTAAELELRKTMIFNEELAQLGRQGLGQKITRYQMNPEKNWGPLTKAMAQ
ncbi:unnamed protein product [Clonostachys rosea]|uniref:tRNA (guanine(26)-N(2))-dimethyltransferase n=1 Tax=Bionectria ochroleuca TaxID=29856 RepID=A0ABY6U1A1_BIOOC|nr:unnamed protein product [Clonostachys rosea]